MPVVVGGIIPRADEERLLEAGVSRVYTPKDFEVTRIMGDIVDLVAEHHGADRKRLTASVRVPRQEKRAGRRSGRPAAPRAARRAPSSGGGCARATASAAPAALNLIEDRSPGARERCAALLAEVSPAALGGEAPAHLVGVTGPAGRRQVLAALRARPRVARAAGGPWRSWPWTPRRSARAARCWATARASSTTPRTTAS